MNTKQDTTYTPMHILIKLLKNNDKGLRRVYYINVSLIDFKFISVVDGKHSQYNFTYFKFIESCFMAQNML